MSGKFKAAQTVGSNLPARFQRGDTRRESSRGETAPIEFFDRRPRERKLSLKPLRMKAKRRLQVMGQPTRLGSPTQPKYIPLCGEASTRKEPLTGHSCLQSHSWMERPCERRRVDHRGGWSRLSLPAAHVTQSLAEAKHRTCPGNPSPTAEPPFRRLNFASVINQQLKGYVLGGSRARMR